MSRLTGLGEVPVNECYSQLCVVIFQNKTPKEQVAALSRASGHLMWGETVQAALSMSRVPGSFLPLQLLLDPIES